MPTTTSAPTESLWGRSLIAAFERQQMTQVDSLVLEPGTGAGTRLRAAGPHALQVSVPLAAREEAAILLEQDGLYTWQVPVPATAAETAAFAAAATRRGQPAAGTGRQAWFRIPLAVGELASDGAGAAQEFFLGRVRAYVFKFAARIVAGQAMKFLERSVQRGLVHLPGTDPARWQLTAPTALPLPTGRPARVLLILRWSS